MVLITVSEHDVEHKILGFDSSLQISDPPKPRHVVLVEQADASLNDKTQQHVCLLVSSHPAPFD